ncbi:hypothetical protein UFOVP1290_553 [uncultured Caudovirales phage]|uniref:Uncharacterized protein n=1 Tax=uncultured Caudovirales phage TaxID=2100421 RepID=A0A6J5RI48_9CAUD|nr:hypothetical protein UFOVP1290_553 [uncultured Caudovirales phage]
MNTGKYNSEIVQVSLSTPFITRARCKFCGKFPSIYFCCRNYTQYIDVKCVKDRLDLIKKYRNSFREDYFLSVDPIFFKSVHDFAYVPEFKAYCPALHRTKGSHNIFRYIDCLTCNCGRSTWYFSQKSIKNRAEIFHRKSKNKFTNKYIY